MVVLLHAAAAAPLGNVSLKVDRASCTLTRVERVGFVGFVCLVLPVPVYISGTPNTGGSYSEFTFEHWLICI